MNQPHAQRRLGAFVLLETQCRLKSRQAPRVRLHLVEFVN